MKRFRFSSSTAHSITLHFQIKIKINGYGSCDKTALLNSFLCKNSTFPYLTRPLSIEHEDRDFKTIPFTLSAHTVSRHGRLYKYSLSSKNMIHL